MSALAPARGSARRLPGLHAVTDDSVLAERGFTERAARVLAAGGAELAMHLRGRRTGPRVLRDLAEGLTPAAAASGAALFVNDRVDVALVAGVDGVHLGRGSLPVAAARRLVGGGTWVGVSTQSAAEVRAGADEGADYAFLGTVFRTASHPGRVGMGVAGLADVIRGVAGLPVIAIGGIGPAQATAVTDAGAYGVAAIRGIWSVDDPAAAVRAYLEGLGTE